MVTQYIMHVTLQTHMYITMVTQHTHVDIHHHGDVVYSHYILCKHMVTQYHVYQLLYLCHHMHIDVRICLHSNMYILRHHGDACICKVPYLMNAKIIILWI